jgi:hypothetical protein
MLDSRNVSAVELPEFISDPYVGVQNKEKLGGRILGFCLRTPRG